MNYLQKKKLVFMSIVNRVKGFIRNVTGAFPLTLTNCVDEESIIDYTLYGESVQNGTPTPDTPIEVESVGEYDESSGKYKIPVTVSGNGESVTTNIYLDEPLRKVGDYADYIKSVDLVNGTGTVVRNIGKYTFTGEENDMGGTNNDLNCFGYTIHLYALSLKSKKVGLCKHLPLYGYVDNSGKSRIAFHTAANHPYCYVFFAKKDFPDLEEYVSPTTAQQVVKQMYDGGEPLVLYYNRNKPTETPITLPTIPTFEGTSILTVDTTIQPSNAEITYYSSLKE